MALVETESCALALIVYAFQRRLQEPSGLALDVF